VPKCSIPGNRHSAFTATEQAVPSFVTPYEQIGAM
jgi:hypothetical protein